MAREQVDIAIKDGHFAAIGAAARMPIDGTAAETLDADRPDRLARCH